MTEEIRNQVEKMGRAFEEFKNANQKNFTEAMQKAAEDVAAKYVAIQAAIEKTEKSANSRIDELEVKLQRPVQGKDANETDLKRARLWQTLRRGRLGEKNAGMDVEQSRQYADAFEAFIRRGDNTLSRLTPEETKALSVGIDPDGGYWVEPAMSTRIVEKIFETSPMRSLATIETISTDELKLPYDADEYSVSTASELGSRSETNTGQIGEYTIPVHEMYAKPKASQKIVEDAAFDIQGYVTRKVTDKMLRTENTWHITGNGVGQARGIMAYNSGTSWLTVQQVASGSASDFTYNGLIDLVASLKQPYHANARFILKRASIANIMKLVDGDGRYIFQPTSVLGFNGQPLLGYPISFADDVAAVAANALAAAFGDFRAAYTIVDRIGMTMLVDPYSSKPYIEYYVRRRSGGAVVNFEAYKIQKIAAS